jgi:hypothetical protein
VGRGGVIINKEQKRLTLQPWLQFECPKCHAAIGDGCWPKQRYSLCHGVRFSLIPVQIKQRLYPVYKLGSCPSSLCKRFCHSLCTGRRHEGDAVNGILCSCQCHLGKEIEIKKWPKKARNPLASTLCQKGLKSHEKCSGMRRLPNNIQVPCECQCHQENP